MLLLPVFYKMIQIVKTYCLIGHITYFRILLEIHMPTCRFAQIDWFSSRHSENQADIAIFSSNDQDCEYLSIDGSHDIIPNIFRKFACVTSGFAQIDICSSRDSENDANIAVFPWNDPDC
jgi:hypothetical protein